MSAPGNPAPVAPVLEVRNLTISYASARAKSRAVTDVSFSIMPGEVVGLVGESGSGKSTVAMAILDLLGEDGVIESGDIRFEGQDLRGLPARDRRALLGHRIGAVFQDPFTSLNPAYAVGDQIAEPLVRHKGFTAAQAAQRVEELLTEVGIREPGRIARAYPHQLSGGMQQRALIATAISCEPRFLILDEPTTALDVTIEAKIIELLASLCDRHKLAALFVSHNLGIVNRLCGSICVLYGSQIVETGKTHDVLARPVHPYTKGLIAALPRIAARRHGRLPSIPGTVGKVSGTPETCVFASRCPFAEEACRREAQILRTTSGGRDVRCWKSDEVVDTPWPAETQTAPLRKAHAPKSGLLIDVEGLCKVFEAGRSILPWRRRKGTVAADNVTFSIERGEVLGLVGESGSGKSTIGRSILALIEPTAGTVKFDGIDFVKQALGGNRELRRRAQLVFQNSAASLNPRKTVGEAVARPLVLAGCEDSQERRDKVAKLLSRVGLPTSYADRYPHELSGGERQRVNIARALASDPEFIVCDEAVSALDVSVQANILNLLSELRDELGLAYLFITHDIAVISHIADRVMVLYGGTVCEEGPIGKVLRPPYHPYTEALLSAVPRLADPKDGPEPARILLEDKTAPSTDGCVFRDRCPRKRGAICDERPPPMQPTTDGHRIACHIPLSELARGAAVFPELPD